MMTFNVDVSRIYRNKEGYKASGYKLNMSFETETHTPQTFIDDVIRKGWPYTMAHLKRSPQETGADKRGVTTPKHTENFTSMQVLTGDDDSKTPNVVDFWLSDPFFSRWGWLFVESVNSKPDAQKGHPTLLFDEAVTDAALYKDCLRAFCTAYPRLDWLINVDRTIYNAKGATVHELGNVCPFADFEREILTPWRKIEAEKQAAIEAEHERRRAEYEKSKAEGKSVSSNAAEAYLAGYLDWLFDHVAGTRKGNKPTRNSIIFWAGRCIAGAESTRWAQPYLNLLGDVDRRIVNAADANGYLADHAQGDENEVLRIFNRGRAAGGDPLDEPLPRSKLTPTATVDADSLGPDPDPLPDCPPLPDEVRLDADLGEGAGGWLYWYVDHAEAISPMTPTSFHLSAGLWLASVVIARRLVLPMAFGRVYPNLFIAWIAPTTLYRKSTALDVARGIARRAIPHLLAAQDTTPEAFLSDLAGREPAHFDQFSVTDLAEWTAGRNFAAQRGWVLDEMSGLLAASGRDYNAGLAEALLRFYDCDPRYTRSTRGQGRVTVRNSYLSMLGASTPAAMSTHLNSERLWSMGFWPRFAILTPNGNPDWKRAQEHDEPAEIVAGLRRLYDALPEAIYPNPPNALTVQLGDGVHTAWERYNKALSYDLLLNDDLDHKLHGTYGRLPVMSLKVATILAALDWSEPPDGAKSNSPTIELPHLARAMAVCEDWRASAHRVIEQAKEQEFDRLRVRILRQIGRFMPNGATLRDLYRGLGKTPMEVELTLSQMVDLGEIEIVEVKQKRGRPTKRYRLVSE